VTAVPGKCVVTGISNKYLLGVIPWELRREKQCSTYPVELRRMGDSLLFTMKSPGDDRGKKEKPERLLRLS
jgi:hypothetical protein